MLLSCPICLDDPVFMTKMFVSTPCGHVFHKECVNKLIPRSVGTVSGLDPPFVFVIECPQCRQIVKKESVMPIVEYHQACKSRELVASQRIEKKFGTVGNANDTQAKRCQLLSGMQVDLLFKLQRQLEEEEKKFLLATDREVKEQDRLHSLKSVLNHERGSISGLKAHVRFLKAEYKAESDAIKQTQPELKKLEAELLLLERRRRCIRRKFVMIMPAAVVKYVYVYVYVRTKIKGWLSTDSDPVESQQNPSDFAV
ncbi:unnamed protein product [Notodromas monacha]|uniref:RING-type domain-containing protein n=1 Tax=Notodromas monacha TaxID=399045 RepID=A0A7R9BXD9_9CRUS|nr:unnamed protein product [Notodromas monacha]CAG0922568.1 unnamed protein product [Notodromas monacha]